MAEVVTFDELGKGDLFVPYEVPYGGYFARVMEKIGGFAQFFNVVPTMFSGVITIPKNEKVIRLQKKCFKEVSVNHLFIPVPEKKHAVYVGLGALYKKVGGRTARLAENLKCERAPLEEIKELADDAEVIDFGDVFKIVTKAELELNKEYGDER